MTLKKLALSFGK
ncbi:hypothetical protein R3I94_007534 [Phoxinus phoxinus]